jgi:SAM-dependent methyltransferase
MYNLGLNLISNSIMNHTLPDEASARMKDLYNRAPFPEVMQGKLPSNNVLLMHWIAASVGRDDIGKNGSRILLAGCGSGEEALTIGQLFPEAQIVGIDFSEVSIQKAKKLAEESGHQNLSFYTADLMIEAQFNQFEPFDLILCHGVADYVTNTEQLFKTICQCLRPKGVLCMTVNSPNHPAARIRTAFRTVGLDPVDFEDTAEQRKLLQLVDRLMANDSGLQGIAIAPKSYLDVDIFAPIAHHDSISVWAERANEQGLNFAGSMDAVLGLTQVSDHELPFLYNLGKPALSLWMSNLCRRPGIQMLFTKQKIEEPDFSDLHSLMDWRPKLDSCLGSLPELSGNPEDIKTLTIRFQGMPDFVIDTTAYDLELLRHCDGKSSLSEIVSRIPEKGNLGKLIANLYRLYQYGLLGSCAAQTL